jgi:hypothetical protein
MGGRQLPRRGQLRVDDAHHFRGPYPSDHFRGPHPGACGSRGRSHFKCCWGVCFLKLAALAALPSRQLVLVAAAGLETRLSSIALVEACFTVSIDLALAVVVDAGTCCHAFVVGVV